MDAVADRLAGRAVIISTLGLSENEWHACKPLKDKFDWKEFMWRGSYPALWAKLGNAPSHNRWYQGHVYAAYCK